MTKHYIPRILAVILCVIAVSYTTQAQEQMRTRHAEEATVFRGSTSSSISAGLPLMEDASRAACDTFNYTAYKTTWSIRHYSVSSPQWGAVNGFNSYGDKAKAQYFANTNANTYCFGARFAFSRATASVPTKTVTFNVWNVSGGNPGTVLGSVTVPMSELIADVSGNYFTDIHFPTPVNTSGQPFFIGIDFSNLTLGDSLGLQSNFHGQTVPTAVWEKQSDNLWYQYNNALSWGLNISIAAFPFMTNVLPDAVYTQSTTNTCSAYPVTFNATASVQTALLWQFQGGTPATSNSLTPTVTWATAGTYTIKLYVLGGSCSALDSAQSTITIIQSPNPAATASPSTICSGQTTTLNANNGTTYNWTGFTAGQNPVTATPAVTTTYTVSVTGSNGCSATQAVPVTVNPTPTVSVNSPTICSGQTATLTGVGAATYSWSGGLGTGNPITASPAVTTTYSVTGTTGLGCSNTASTIVTVTPTPNVTVNSPTICAGGTATLTASGATTYLWTGGLGSANPATTSPASTTTYTVSGTTTGCTGTATSVVTVNAVPNVTVNSPSICAGGTATLTASGATAYNWSGGMGSGNPVNPSPATTTTYTVTGTTLGCSATANAIVTVTAIPVVGVNSPTICAGQTATLTATGATTYNWSDGLGTGNPKNVSPAVTTTYTVTGTTSGCSGTTTSVVIVNPVPSVTVNSPTICAGGTATLTANGASSYTWTGGLTGNPANATPATTTTYTVTGTSGGCSETTTAVVTVNALPNITVNSPTICAGGTATLTASGGTSYSWSDGLGTGNPVTVTPGATTTYTVTGTLTGCSSSATAIVTIGTSLSITVNSPSICLGQTATLTASGATTYNWSDGLGTGNPMTASPAVTTTYTVTGTTVGCTGTTTTVVTVNSPISVSVNNATICSGDVATLTANGGTTYNWSGGLGTGNPATASPTTTTTYTVTGTTGACTSTAQSIVTVNALPTILVNSPSVCLGSTATLTASGASSYNWSGGLGTGNPVTVTPSANVTYTVSGTDLGCTGTAQSVITVNTAPTITVNSPTICSGETITLTAVGGSSYSWDNGLGTGNPVTATPLVNTTYTVTGTDLGCSGTAQSIVTVYPTPVVVVTGDSVCTGQQATLTASGANSYAWSNGLGVGSVVNTPVLTTNTTYTVTGTSLGCNGTTTVVVTVSSIPSTPVITDIGGGVLSSSSPTGNQWYLNGTPIPGETNQTCNATATGNYSVIVTINGCSSAVSNIIYAVGIDDISNSSISVYPNPTHGSITVDLGSVTSETEIQLFNLLGESLIKINNQGQSKVVLDLNPYSNGVYCVRIFTDGKVINTRVVKQN